MSPQTGTRPRTHLHSTRTHIQTPSICAHCKEFTADLPTIAQTDQPDSKASKPLVAPNRHIRRHMQATTMAEALPLSQQTPMQMQMHMYAKHTESHDNGNGCGQLPADTHTSKRQASKHVSQPRTHVQQQQHECLSARIISAAQHTLHAAACVRDWQAISTIRSTHCGIHTGHVKLSADTPKQKSTLTEQAHTHEQCNQRKAAHRDRDGDTATTMRQTHTRTGTGNGKAQHAPRQGQIPSVTSAYGAKCI